MVSDWAAAARPLEGKVAIVTGAGRGIGAAIASGYAAAGGPGVLCRPHLVGDRSDCRA